MTAFPLFKNNATSRLASAASASADAVQVLPGEGVKFPAPAAGEMFLLVLEDRRTGQFEICQCTNRSGDLLYVTRAQEGTTAQDFLLGATASNRFTAATWNAITGAFYSKIDADAAFVNVTGDAMTGPLTLPGDPATDLQAATKHYVDTVAALFGGVPEAPIDGKLYGRKDFGWVETLDKPTINAADAALQTQITANTGSIATHTGQITALQTEVSTMPHEAPTDGQTYARQSGAWAAVDLNTYNKTQSDARYINVAGDTMIGTLTLAGNPVSGGEAANKQYVDAGLATKLDASVYTAADVMTKVKANDGAGSGVDADLLDGNDSAFFATAAGLATANTNITALQTGKLDASVYTAADILTKLKTVDGPGSGLDADLLDGHDTTYFATSAALVGNYLPFTGGTMLGKITLDGDPNLPLQAATKQYVDAKPAGAVISDTAPASPSQGQTWWQSNSGGFFISYNDGNSTQWVQINGPQPASFPEAPQDGNLYGRQSGAWSQALAGPASAVDNILARFDGTSGKIIQGGNATLDDSGNLILAGYLTTAYHLVSSQTTMYLGTTGAGTISFRPNGIGSASGEVYINSLGNVIADSGIVRSSQFGSAGSFVGYSAAADCFLRPNGGGSTSGQLRLSTNGVLVMTHDTQQKPTAGQWSASSDARIKNILRDYAPGLDAILALRPRVFTYKGNDSSGDPAIDAMGNKSEEQPVVPYEASPHYQMALDGKETVGLIAQEAREAMPELVTVSDITTWLDGVETKDVLDVNPTNIMYALINAVRELSAKVDALEAARV